MKRDKLTTHFKQMLKVGSCYELSSSSYILLIFFAFKFTIFFVFNFHAFM